MKVFISWSGEQSKAIAAVFKDWIPAVIQAARPYFSPNDIDKGSRWASEISKELEAARIGLICLTKDNLKAPWLMFEAGALSKSIETSRVCPMLFGVDPSDLTGPLVQFQAAVFSKEEVRKFIGMVNQQLDASSLSATVLDSVFEKWWPDLQEKVDAVLKKEAPERGHLRSDREVLEEVLELARTFSREARSEAASELTVGRAIKIADSLHDLGKHLLGTATTANQLATLEKTLVIVMRALIPVLTKAARAELDPRMVALITDVQEKITELEDDIPF